MAKKSSGTNAVTELSINDLQAELRRREALVSRLRRQHARHLERAAKVEAQIRSLGGVSGGRGGRIRPRNDMNLVDALAKTLQGTTLSVTELAEAVQKNGYQTTSPNFRTIVNQALIKFPSRFKKVARGQYTAK